MTRELVLTRIFAVPIELVWRSWSDPGRMLRWWNSGIPDSTHLDLEEVVPLKRLVCVLRVPGKKGTATMRTEVAFDDLGSGRTKLTITTTSQETLEWSAASRRS